MPSGKLGNFPFIGEFPPKSRHLLLFFFQLEMFDHQMVMMMTRIKEMIIMIMMIAMIIMIMMVLVIMIITTTITKGNNTNQ